MKKKYCLHPGLVTSRDGHQKYYVGFDQLVRLYGLDREECTTKIIGDTRKLIHLFPLSNGYYEKLKKVLDRVANGERESIEPDKPAIRLLRE